MWLKIRQLCALPSWRSLVYRALARGLPWQFVLSVFLGFSGAAFAEDDPGSSTVGALVMPKQSDYGVGSWIWASETRDQQTCLFWKSIEVSGDVPVARPSFVSPQI